MDAAPLASEDVPPEDAPVAAGPAVVAVETTDGEPALQEEPAPEEEPYLEEPDILVIVAAPTAPGRLPTLLITGQGSARDEWGM